MEFFVAELQFAAKIGTLIIVGLIAGGLAKFIMPGKDPGGIFVTALLGIAGAVVGGLVANKSGITGSSLPSEILIATAGAFALLLLYRLFIRKS